MENYLRDLREGDLEYLSEHLREADKEEVLVSSGSVLEALQESVSLSSYVKIIDASGVPMGILGVAPFNGVETQALWMLATPELEEHKFTFLRNSREEIQNLFLITEAERFFNYTYAKNTLHHRWLRWVGALFGPEPVLVGPEKKAFLPFVIQRETYV